MFGISFKNTVDTRKLMLDYTFQGYPLVRSFAVSGYEELEYNNVLKWLTYSPLKLFNERET